MIRSPILSIQLMDRQRRGFRKLTEKTIAGADMPNAVVLAMLNLPQRYRLARLYDSSGV